METGQTGLTANTSGIIRIYNNSEMLIKFRGTNEMFIFNTAKALKRLLINHDKYGIDYIKLFDKQDLKFKRVNKNVVKDFFNHDEYLVHNHFNSGWFK